MRDREWQIYDKYNIFSLGYESQLKFCLLSLVIGVPAALIDHFDIVTYIGYMSPNSYKFIRIAYGWKFPYNFDVTLLENLFGLFCVGLSILSNSLRYRPLLNIIYVSGCVRRHLRVISNQLIMNHPMRQQLKPTSQDECARMDRTTWTMESNNNGKPLLNGSAGSQHNQQYQASTTYGMFNNNKSVETSCGNEIRINALMIESRRLDHSQPSAWVDSKKTGSGAVFVGNNNKKRPIISRLSGIANSLRARFFSRNQSTNQDINGASSIMEIETGFTATLSESTSSGSLSNAPSLAQLIRTSPASSSITTKVANSHGQILAEEPTTSSLIKSNEELVCKQQQASTTPVCTIRSLRQFELHLTKLDFFVGDMDRCAGSLVFAMCILSLVQFIYSIFFLIDFWRSYTNLLLGVLYCLSRLSTPFLLFMSGNSMEREARKLLAELEVIYLQDSTQCLIYKQYGSTMASLSRVIKLLNSIKFSCDNLMNINLGTMKKFIFYTVTSMFIVVQYGK